MEYFLKIKSEIDCTIFIENQIKKPLKKDDFIKLLVDIKNNESFEICVEPTEKTTSLILGYKILVENHDNALNFYTNNLEVLNYKNTYILHIKKVELFQNFVVLENSSKYLIYNTSFTNISTKNFTLTLPCLFDKVETKNIGKNTIITFSNSLENQNYVVVFYNDKIIFKDYYTKINLDNKIEILSSVFDIAKHAIITKIEDEILSQKTVYLLNKPILTECDKIIPLAFLEALKIENLKLCKYYLSENLKEKTTLEILKNYFKDYKKVEYEDNNYILFYKDKSYKTANFIVENHKITKIDLI